MRSEQWIRTQKRRVRKKYRKVGNMYFSPREIRKIKNGMFLKSLIKAINNLNKGFQELAAVLNEMANEISAYKEESKMSEWKPIYNFCRTCSGGLPVPDPPEWDDYEEEDDEDDDEEDCEGE